MDTNDYWSIESILADNQKLPCTFELDVPGLGYMEGAGESDLRQGSKVELPYYLVSNLVDNPIRPFVSFTIPPPFAPRVRNALNAEPRSVKLSNLVGGLGGWYGFGMRVAGFGNDALAEAQSNMIYNTLSTTFKFRLPEVQDQASHVAATTSHSQASVGAEFRDGLESEEREFFAIAQESARRMKVWYDGSSLMRGIVHGGAGR